jgi:membrane protein
LNRPSRYSLSGFGTVLKTSFAELLRNDPLRMAGATAFFTTFALPPILVILIQVLRLFVNPRTIRQELFGSLQGIVGEEVVEQIVTTLQSLRSLAHNWPMTIAGFVFLLFVATTLFKVINSSLNQLWNIRRTDAGSAGLRLRLKAILVILIAGVLFMIGLVAEAVQTFVGGYLYQLSPVLSFYFHTVINYLISFFVVMLWFALLFRYLPDGKPQWSIAFSGAFFTSVLFSIGRIVLHFLLSYSNINTVYGASASIVLLLLFVFYSALILYFGAVFTKQWGLHRRKPIQPLPGARVYRVVEEER